MHPAESTRAAANILRDLGTPCIIHQPRYSMLDRAIETTGTLDALADEGMGCIPFSPLAQGLLTNKYLAAVPQGSRATQGKSLNPAAITPKLQAALNGLNAIAQARGQSLMQMALTWVLRDARITSALMGASTVEQIEEAVKALDGAALLPDELARIDGNLAAA